MSPIWYLFEDGQFYFTTRLGRLKGQHIQKNPLAALSIATDEQPYRAVTAFGRTAIVKENRDEWMEKISSKYGKKENEQWLAEAIRQHDRVVMVLKPERVLSWHYGRDDGSRQDKGESMTTPI